jgi:nucleotide-binding universal stress UspA family protein
MDDSGESDVRYTTVPRRLIAPVTFADDSLEAAAVAASLAAALDGELILAGIAPLAPPEAMIYQGEPGIPSPATGQQELVDRIVAERLEEFAGALPPRLPARTLVAHGSVGETLVAVARDEGADLVVVPMRREPTLAHLLHDHADRYVLHHCEVPVLVVPTNGGAPYGRVPRAEQAPDRPGGR